MSFFSLGMRLITIRGGFYRRIWIFGVAECLSGWVARVAGVAGWLGSKSPGYYAKTARNILAQDFAYRPFWRHTKQFEVAVLKLPYRNYG